MLNAILLSAGERVGWNVCGSVRPGPLHGRRESPLYTPSVRIEHRACMLERRDEHLCNAVHRSANHHKIRPTRPLRDADRASINRAKIFRSLQLLHVAIDANDAPGNSARLRRKPHGAANEPDADNRDLIEQHAEIIRTRRQETACRMPLLSVIREACLPKTLQLIRPAFECHVATGFELAYQRCSAQRCRERTPSPYPVARVWVLAARSRWL